MTFAATAALFGAGGYWLDSRADTLPLFLILGLLLGFAAGFLHLLSVVAPDLMPFRKKSADDAPSTRTPPHSADPSGADDESDHV